MNEYIIYNRYTNEEDCIYGYTFKDACERSKLNPADWVILHKEYID
jgi:hypothetical protein